MPREAKIDVDDRGMIKLMRRSSDARLTRLASELAERIGPFIEKTASKHDRKNGRISGTVMSPGLKLVLKKDFERWKAGSLWIIADFTQRVDDDRIMLTHDGDTVDSIVVMKDKIDKLFELR